MLKVEEIINAVDKEIKIKRLYLHKKHKNGIFNFQKFGLEYEPYDVKYEKVIKPFILKLMDVKEDINYGIKDIYLLDDSYPTDIDSFLHNGILTRTILLDKQGNIVLTNYYKNVAPQHYTYTLKLPEKEELRKTILERFEMGFRGLNKDNCMFFDIHLPKEARKEFKALNPEIDLKKHWMKLKKQDNIITWKDVNQSVISIISKLDDTCVNILNRIDYINFLANNVSEIKNAIDKVTPEEKSIFKKYNDDNKDWFNLIVEAIDLTKNSFYKQFVDVEVIKEQASNINEIIQYITLNIILDSNKQVVKKNKI